MLKYPMKKYLLNPLLTLTLFTLLFVGCTQIVTAPISIAGSVAGATIDVAGSAVGAVTPDGDEED